jgi:NADH dehydrogenase
MAQKRPLVVIVGAGFGGLRAARALAKAPVDVVLIDRRNYHLFQPLLYQVATAGVSPGEIAHPVRGILRGQKNLKFRLAEVQSIDFSKRRLVTSVGPQDYDYLILAVGGETNYFGLDSIARNSLTLKDLDDAIAIRNQILRSFELGVQEPDPEKRRALLTFVLVGGGPTGIESSGALSELIRLVLIKDYPELNFKDVRVLILEATDHVLAGFPKRLQDSAAETLWNKHVEVRFGAMVTDFDGKRIMLRSGEVIPAHTLIWAAGVRAAGMLNSLDVQQASNGRVVVTPTLQIEKHPDVYVIGDAAYLEKDGQPLPMMAPVAIQMAEVAAKNIQLSLQGKSPVEFIYKDPGSLATIGRNAAVARIHGFQFSGFVAWVVWLAVHLIQLIGFRNRLLVLINWAWDYFFYERAVRLITPYGRHGIEDVSPSEETAGDGDNRHSRPIRIKPKPEEDVLEKIGEIS